METIGCRDDACSIASSIAYGSLEDNTSACDEMMECVNNGALGQKRMPGKSTTMPHLNTIAATVRAHGCIPELQGLSTLASLGFNEMMSPSQEVKSLLD